jgi:glycosyltransferase 2 family protein
VTPFRDPSSRPPAPPPEPVELTPEELAHFRAVTDESSEAAQEYERKRTNWLRYVILFVILGLGISILLPQVGDLRKSLRILREMHMWALGLAVLCEVASYTALGYMMHRIVGLTGQRLPMRRAIAVTVASGSVGLVAGGLVGMGGSSYRWLRDGGVRTEGAVLAGWLPTLLNAAMVALCAIVGMITLALMGELTPALWGAFAFSLLTVIGAGWLAWYASRHHAAAERFAVRTQARWARFRKKPEKPEQVRATVAGMFDALSLLKRRGWKGPALGSLMGVTLDALCMYFVFVAAQRPVAFGVLLAGYGIPLLVGKVGVIPGGVGLVETMMILIFNGIGVPMATATSVVLGFRVLSFWLPNLAGFGIMPMLQTSRRVRDPADTPSRAT